MPSAMNRTMSTPEWAMLLSLSVLWGGSFFFTHVALSALPPLTLVVLRVGLAALILNAVVPVLGLAMPRDLQHVEVSGEVRVEIGARVLDRIAHAGLRTQMDNPIKFLVGERGVECLVISEVDLHEGEVAAHLLDFGQPVAF